MKTAMQELIDELKAISTAVSKENNLDMVAAFSYAIDMARLSIKKEKEQIINAHTNAYLIGEDNISVEDANKASEQYYNQTYNQNQ